MRSMFTKLRGKAKYATAKHYRKWQLAISPQDAKAQAERERERLLTARKLATKQNKRQRKHAKCADLECAPTPIVLRKLGTETKFEREARKQESMAHYEAMRRGSTVKASTGRKLGGDDAWFEDWYRETWGEDC